MVASRIFPIYMTLIAALAACMMISATTGSVAVPLREVFSIAVQALLSGETTTGTYEQILLSVRFPRLIMGAIVGATLAVAGLVYQNTLRNPLAEPYILGVSSGAAFFAVLGGWLFTGAYVPSVLSSFLGGLLAITLLLAIAKMRGERDDMFLLLAGVMINFLMGALMMATLFISKPQGASEVLYLWMGSFSGLWTWEIYLMLGVLAFGLGYVLYYARPLDALSVSNDWAYDIGYDARGIRLKLLVVSSLMVAASVAFVGMVGFVGLIAPHLMRLILKADARALLPATAICGALITVVADGFARQLTLFHTELPVGVVSAFIGSPLFLWLMIQHVRRHREIR